MRSRFAVLASVLVAVSATPRVAHAQKLLDVTIEIIDRWFTAHDKEKSETANLGSAIADQDAKINKFEQCKRDLETAGAIAGGKLSLAARLLVKAKCGASDADGYRKDRAKIMEGPEKAAAAAGNFKLDEYRNLTEKLNAYANGDGSGFTKPSLDILKTKLGALRSAFGVTAVAGGGGMGAHGPAVWTQDYAWIYIAALFQMQYLSGATMFETDYKPGEWTRWSMSGNDGDSKQVSERAFLGKQADGGEWWRVKTITTTSDGVADTVSLEALFKAENGNDQVQTLVRMRGKLPGNSEAQELIVPQQWSMWNMSGSMGRKPTKESIDGATVGTESVTTPAGTFKAKHVRFGAGGGTLDWWLDDATVGGWVKFQVMDNDKKPQYTQELVGKGTGAKSELGVTIK